MLATGEDGHSYLISRGWTVSRVNNENVYSPPRASKDSFTGLIVAYPLDSAYAIQLAQERRARTVRNDGAQV